MVGEDEYGLHLRYIRGSEGETARPSTESSIQSEGLLLLYEHNQQTIFDPEHEIAEENSCLLKRVFFDDN